MKNKALSKKSVLIGISSAILLYFIFGSLTAIIRNSFFIRMMPVRWFDYIFLILTSALSGIYIGMTYYNKKSNPKCDYFIFFGNLGSILSFGCAMCNHLLVYLLGTVGVMVYFAPFQPILGVLSILLLIYSIIKQYNELQKHGRERNEMF